MKVNFILWGILVFVFVSCIQDEPLNREADILDMYIEDDAFITRGISENSIQLVVTDNADYSRLAPLVEVTPGAQVEPASGSVMDFSGGKTVIYKVTAEDRSYHKDYTVSVVSKISLKHEFEDWTTSGVGKAVHPILGDLLWSNANSGLAVLVALNIVKLDHYPTDKTTDCVSGEYAAMLQTIKGAVVFGNNYPIFAGSLFRGNFSANMSNPLKSLRLGQVHNKEQGKPSLFNGYYKYSPGEVFTGPDGNVIPNRVDSMSMYAAIFRVTKGASPDAEYLDGESILASERVIGKAEWKANSEHVTETEAKNGFIRFSIPFEYKEEPDYNKYDYRLTVVCSSSKDGNEYQGAVGSKLIVDNLEIICDPIF
jgi:hypothetical protein